MPVQSRDLFFRPIGKIASDYLIAVEGCSVTRGECFPCMCKVPGSIPSTTDKKLVKEERKGQTDRHSVARYQKGSDAKQ